MCVCIKDRTCKWRKGHNVSAIGEAELGFLNILCTIFMLVTFCAFEMISKLKVDQTHTKPCPNRQTMLSLDNYCYFGFLFAHLLIPEKNKPQACIHFEIKIKKIMTWHIQLMTSCYKLLSISLLTTSTKLQIEI